MPIELMHLKFLQKWELANLLEPEPRILKQVLHGIFMGVIEELQEHTITDLDTPLRERVWTQVSPVRMSMLKNIWLGFFCETILREFSNYETIKMIEQINFSGSIDESEFKERYELLISFYEQQMIDKMYEEGESLVMGWTTEIQDALIKEGIVIIEELPPEGT